jgi:electron transport complex protein RnfG
MVVFTTMLIGMDRLTRPTIERGRREQVLRGVLSVLGFEEEAEADPLELEDVFKERVEVVEREGMTVYKGYRNGELVGYAFIAGGGGFQGWIEIVVGIEPDLETIMGIWVLESGETPGLGGRIVEQWFQEQFKGLKIAPQIEFVKYVEPTEPNQFQAISGATFTMAAVQDMLNRGIQRLKEMKDGL